MKDGALVKGEQYYLVKWEGWPAEYNLWVPEKDMGDAKEAIRHYEKKKGH